MNAYEQMFFNKETEKEKSFKQQLPPTGGVSNNKNQQMVDLGGMGLSKYQSAQPDNQFTQTSAGKSMIGHSDFVPVGDATLKKAEGNPYNR